MNTNAPTSAPTNTHTNAPAADPHRRRRRARRTALVIALLAVAGTATSFVAAAGDDDHTSTIEVDVAENGTRFVIAEQPVFEDGMPAYGNAFITEGYLYPAGTLSDSNGVNPDGSPEFPDEVIGTWTCTGYFIADGARTTEGSWVYSTQLFAFGDDPDSGAQTVVVTGFEGAVPDDVVTGAITGGTGEHAGSRGEAHQEFMGMNNPELATMGINKTVDLRIEE